MDTGQVAVATITWARSVKEEMLLGRALEALARTRLPAAVADRGTSPAFTDRLRSMGAFRVAVTTRQGLVPQVQASLDLAAAFATRFILYVEPDKGAFFEQGMGEFLREAPDADDVGVVLASRSERSFQTFPPMQRYAEGVINQLCAEVIGIRGDYSYGPFVMDRALVPHVSGLDSQLGWGWRHSTFVAAARRRQRLVHIVGDYECPLDQRDEDDDQRTHRMRQLSQNILGLIT